MKFWLIWRETDWSGRVTCALQTESNERETDAVTSGDKATKTALMNSVEWIIHAVHVLPRLFCDLVAAGVQENCLLVLRRTCT